MKKEFDFKILTSSERNALNDFIRVRMMMFPDIPFTNHLRLARRVAQKMEREINYRPCSICARESLYDSIGLCRTHLEALIHAQKKTPILDPWVQIRYETPHEKP